MDGIEEKKSTNDITYTIDNKGEFYPVDKGS